MKKLVCKALPVITGLILIFSACTISTNQDILEAVFPDEQSFRIMFSSERYSANETIILPTSYTALGATVSLAVENTSADSIIEVQTIVLSDPAHFVITADSFPVSIPKLESKVIRLNFNSTEEGKLTSKMTVNYTIAGKKRSFSVKLEATRSLETGPMIVISDDAGAAIENNSVSPYNFGSGAATIDKTFTVSNTGTGALVIQAIISSSASFSILAPATLPVTVNPGETTSLTVRRAATFTTGPAIISLVSNATNWTTFTLNVLAPTTNADLSGLAVSSGTLYPVFDNDTVAYTLNVANSASSITITGTSSDDGASVGGQSGIPVALNVGTNTITITVIAQDETTTKNYVIIVRRGAANDYLSPTLGFLKYVPTGSFQRDSTVTNISILTTAFRMSEKEITREQWLMVMGEDTDPSSTPYSSGLTDPVQNVNWYHAIAFCNFLSIREGLDMVYSVPTIDFTTLTYLQIPTVTNANWNLATATWNNNGYRLPTEMEWEWAAMGATSDRSNSYLGVGINTKGYLKTFAGYLNTTATLINDYAWSNGNTIKTQSAGSKIPNELGIYDMSGNVAEWCWDFCTTTPAVYTAGTLTDDRGSGGTYRIRRGGGFSQTTTYL